MKRILFACLLGAGTLLPSTEAKSSVVYFSKVVDVTISGWVLTAISQTEDGVINKIEVYHNGTMELVLYQACGGTGYSCNLDVSDLASGTYTAKVYCTNTVYTEQFSR
ncbi:MAG TPA: Ig-like domain-containing protein [Chitinophagales bacterium]|nr:Ig-like domain-containing protein [Chitinophagales bacterium]